MEIRSFEERDLDKALEIYNYYVKNSTATFSIEEVDIDELRESIVSGRERFPSFCYEVDGVMAGYGLLHPYMAREAYDGTAVVTIYIAPEHLGKGYGKLGLEHLMKVAKDNDFKALLAIICAENKASVNLFMEYGFFEAGNLKQVGKKFDRILDVVIYEAII